jgi:hypothetical protein
MDACSPATDIRAVSVVRLDCGFRLLVLRQYHIEGAPPAFALIEQRLLRTPQRFGRHGLFFANTFLPDVTAWLSEHLGRPSLRGPTEQPQRNPRWPIMKWHAEDRAWPDGTDTTEWFVDVTFHDLSSWRAFLQRWHAQLLGEIESDAFSGAGHT